MALYLDVYVLADAEIFDIEASGTIEINTCAYTERMGIEAASFYLALYGHVEVLEVLKFDADFSIKVGGSLGPGQWRFDFDTGIDFFGLMTLDGYGYIDSLGNFDINLDGYMQLGPNGFCIKGTFHFNITSENIPDLTGNPYYYFDLTLSASVSAEVFGITLASVGLSASFHAEGAGRQPLTLTIKVKIKILFIKITKTAKFNIGYLSLPKAVYLGGEQINGRNWTEDGGDLYLNMGPRSGFRYDNPADAVGEDDESFIIEQLDGNENGGTIKVTAFGRTRVYTNASSIHADGGTGDDSIVITDSVKIPVYISGGTGEDVLIHQGTNNATINGGADADYIACAGSGSSIINGGDGDDFIVYAGTGTATIHGGNGDDRIFGGPGNDIIYGDDGSDEIDSGGGTDSIYGGNGSDLITIDFGGLGSTVYGGAQYSGYYRNRG